MSAGAPHRFLCVTALLLCAIAGRVDAQEDLFKHLYWSAKGNHDNQSVGGSGLDYIGYVNDTIQHAFALGSDGGSSYVFNRFPGDTARQYKFPGQKVIRANFNGDGLPDFVCWDMNAGWVSVLFGTSDPSIFDTILVLKGGENQHFKNLENRIIVADIDSSGTDDLLIDDMYLVPPDGYYASRWLWYRGVPGLDTMPTFELPSEPAEFITVCRPRDSVHRFIGRTRGLGGHFPYPDTVKLTLYPIGPNFQFIPTDSMLLTVESPRFCCLNYVLSVQIQDVDEDGVDDLMLVGYDNSYGPNLQVDPTVFVYKGGETISSLPTYFFHRPFQTNSSEFGSKIVDLGNVTGWGYHTIAITDPDASAGGSENGAVFLYNIGRALKDSCVGFGVGPQGYMDKFGSNIISLGVDASGVQDFAVGADADSIGFPGSDFNHVGRLFVFHGSPTLGPPLSVMASTTSAVRSFEVSSYPNPFSASTTISLRLPAFKQESRLILTINDLLGREVGRMYDGPENHAPHLISVSRAMLRTGTYFLRLSCGGVTLDRIMQLVD